MKGPVVTAVVTALAAGVVGLLLYERAERNAHAALKGFGGYLFHARDDGLYARGTWSGPGVRPNVGEVVCARATGACVVALLRPEQPLSMMLFPGALTAWSERELAVLAQSTSGTGDASMIPFTCQELRVTVDREGGVVRGEAACGEKRIALALDQRPLPHGAWLLADPDGD